MAVQIEVREKKGDQGRVSAAGLLQTTASYQKEYNIETFDDEDPAYDGTKTDAADVVNADGMPVVNLDPYFYQDDDGAWKIIPYAICNGKNVTRHRQRNTIWTGQATFQTERLYASDRELRPQTILDDPTGYTKLVGQTTGETKKVRWQSRDDPPKPLRLPTGNYFSEPFDERVGTSSYRILQVENHPNESKAEEAAEQRTFLINADNWTVPRRDGRDPIDPGFAMIVDCTQRPVRFPNSLGDLPPLAIFLPTMFLFSYTIDISSRDGGYNSKRALIDNYFLKTPGDITTREPNRSREGGAIVSTLIASDGQRKENHEHPDTLPDFETFQIQESINFSSLFG